MSGLALTAVIACAGGAGGSFGVGMIALSEAKRLSRSSGGMEGWAVAARTLAGFALFGLSIWFSLAGLHVWTYAP